MDKKEIEEENINKLLPFKKQEAFKKNFIKW